MEPERAANSPRARRHHALGRRTFACVPTCPDIEHCPIAEKLSRLNSFDMTATLSTEIVDALGAYAAKDPCHFNANVKNALTRENLATERARIWARDIGPFVRQHGLRELMLLVRHEKEAISKVAARANTVAVQAANTLGTLSGSIITQNYLSLLRSTLPSLSLFSTDFTSDNAKLNQQVISRIRGIPIASTYSPATGYSSTAAVDTDVPVTITQHSYVQFDYNANELASTGRNLFAEQSEGALYALAKSFVDSALALFTLANFSAGAQHTVVTSANWNRVALINARAALKGRHVSVLKGFALQNPTYFGALSEDPAIVSLATFQDKEIITEGVLPRISGIKPVEYADFPANGASLTAVVGAPECVVIATRLPYDYVDAQIGSNYGAVSQVTDAETGLSVMLTQYVNHDASVSRYRVAAMLGSAVGDSTRAQLITSV